MGADGCCFIKQRTMRRFKLPDACLKLFFGLRGQRIYSTVWFTVAFTWTTK